MVSLDSTEKTPQSSLAIALATEVASLWWLVLLRGVLLVVLGGYALASPGMTLAAFTQALGVFVLIDGVLAIVAGLLGWVKSRFWMVVRGVLGIAIGVFVIGHPVVVGAIAAAVVMIIIAVQTIVCGILEVIAAIRHRKEIRGEAWLILGGVLSVVLGALLLATPLLSSLVLIRIVGLFAIFFGLSMIWNSFRIRQVGKTLAAVNS
jgi:uncharacterized membrane protein HdeD (DUF308 family)